MSQQDNINRRIFESLGEDLPQTLAQAIQEAADRAIEDVKNGLVTGPNASNALRDSIEAIVDESTLTLGIRMLDYGYFQNYGVTGTKNIKTQFGVPQVVKDVLPPRQGETYSFNPDNKMIGGDLPFGVRVKIHRDGLEAKQFLNIEAFTQRVADYVNENLELI
jgi:hypothetical protein